MSQQLVPVNRKYRKSIPESHRQSLDTRILWLWNQRFGTIQMVWKESGDILDKTAATLYLQAIMAKDLDSIAQIFQRIEGGPLTDDDLLEQAESEVRV
jgi:hypothetical protein